MKLQGFYRSVKTQLASHPVLAASLVYFCLASIFLYPLFLNKALFYVDDLLHIAPMYHFWKTEVLSGRLPLWNPFVFAGLPFLADPAHPVFSPFNIFFLLFSNLVQAVSFQALVFVFLSALGGFILARSLLLELIPCLYVGLVFGFSGSVFEAANDVNTLAGIVFIPWIYAVFVKDFIHKRCYFSWKLALLLALQLLSGHSQYVYYTLLILGVYYALFVFKEKISYRKRVIYLMSFGVSIILAFLMAAIQLVPTLELLEHTQREQNLDLALVKGLNVESLPRLIFPKIYGSWVEGNSWGPNSQHDAGLANTAGFISLSALIFAGIALFKSTKRQYIYPLAGTVFLTFLLAFGSNLPLFSMFHAFVPGFSSFRSPTRVLIMYSLAMAVLSGIGLQFILNKKSAQNTFVKVLGWGATATVSIALITLIIEPAFLIFSFIKLYELVKHVPFQGSVSYSLEKIDVISSLLMQSAVIFALGLIGFYALFHFSISKQKKWILIGFILLLIELFLSVRGNLFFADVNKMKANDEVVAFLQRNLDGQRYISISNTQAYIGVWTYLNHLAVRPPFSQGSVTHSELKTWDRMQTEMTMLPANIHQFYNLNHVAGYVAILPKPYRDYWQSKLVNTLDIKAYDNPLLDEFSAQYVVSGIPIDVVTDTKNYLPVFRTGDIVVYQNTKAKKRASFLIDNQQVEAVIRLNDVHPQQVAVHVQAPNDGKLLLRDFYYPGWQARVDGKVTQIEPYQGIFRSVKLSAGEHTVVFDYKPRSVTVGFGITVVSALLLLLGLWVQQRIKNV